MAVDEGFQATCQDFLNDGIAANFFSRSAKLNFLAHLGGENSKPMNTEVGRPSGQIILKGTKMSPIQKMSLAGYNSFKPAFAINNPTAATILGARDNSPQLTNATLNGNSQGQIRGTAEVRWTGLMEDEILIWETELQRALRDAGDSKKGRGIARSRILLDATNLAKQNILNLVDTELQSGQPTDQDMDPWDHMLGWSQWFSATNVCARVDRNLAKNAQWRARVDATSYPTNAEKLIDVANYGTSTVPGLADLSEDGAVALFVNSAQFVKMKAECEGKGFTQVTNSIPGMAGYGTKNLFVLQKDNVFIVRDRTIPANTAYAIVPNTWMFLTEPDNTFVVGEFVQLKNYKRGGEHALRALVSLQCMLVCTNPYINMVFTNVAD